MTHATYSKFESQSLLVNEDALKKLFKLFSDRLGTARISAACSDDMTREFSDVASLLSFENGRAAKIETLTIVASDHSRSNFGFLRFAGGFFSIEIKAREDVATRLKTRTSEIIVGCRPWYWFFDNGWVSLAFVLIMQLPLQIFINRKNLFSEPPTSLSDISIFSAVYILLPLLGGIVGIKVYLRIRKLFFQDCTFLIGQEKQQHQTREMVRWGVIIAFVVSVAAGLVVPVGQMLLGVTGG